jgi:hypothetical protein
MGVDGWSIITGYFSGRTGTSSGLSLCMFFYWICTDSNIAIEKSILKINWQDGDELRTIFQLHATIPSCSIARSNPDIIKVCSRFVSSMSTFVALHQHCLTVIHVCMQAAQLEPQPMSLAKFGLLLKINWA